MRHSKGRVRPLRNVSRNRATTAGIGSTVGAPGRLSVSVISVPSVLRSWWPTLLHLVNLGRVTFAAAAAAQRRTSRDGGVRRLCSWVSVTRRTESYSVPALLLPQAPRLAGGVVARGDVPQAPADLRAGVGLPVRPGRGHLRPGQRLRDAVGTAGVHGVR